MGKDIIISADLLEELCSDCQNIILESQPMEDEDRISEARLAISNTTEDLAARMRARTALKQSPEYEHKQAQRRLAKEEAKATKKKTAPVSANTVEQWWKESMRAAHPEITHARWSLKEKSWAVELIETWGPTKVQRAVTLMFERWSKYRVDYSWKNLSKIPDFNFLYYARKEIFVEVETVERKASAPIDEDIF